MGEDYRLYPSIRLCMILLSLTGITVLGGGFAAFNFAIVCMVNETGTSVPSSTVHSNVTSSLSQCDYRSMESESDIMGYDGEFRWDRTIQAHLLAAHAYGALLMNIPSGLVSDRYGSKLVIAACVLANAVASAVTPIAAYAGPEWVFVARVIQGFGYGASWPTILSLVPTWSTMTEAGLFISLGAIGYQTGTLVAMVTSSTICDSSLRWPFIFYLWCGLSVAFLVFWLTFYTDDPETCRFISRGELDYLQKFKMRKSKSNQSFWRIPWRKILCSPCAIATHVCQFAATWSIYYIGEYLPTYSKEVLLFDVRNNGIASAVPALSQVIGRAVLGPIADKITFFGRSKTFSVKLFSALGTVVPCACFIAVGFFDCRHTVLAVAAFSIASAAMATNTVGYGRGGVLMAPRYAGALGSISNSYGDAAALIMPYIVGTMAAGGTVPEWQHTAWLTASVMAVSFVMYQAFGTAVEQKWETEPKKSGSKIYTVDPKGGV